MSGDVLTVLHSESSLGWGGQENRILNEMIGLRELGHHSLVVCRPGARLAERAREAGFQAFEVPMRNALDLAAVLHLRSLMRRTGTHIVNTHSGRDTQLAGMAARSLLARRPRVVRTRHLAMPITSRFTYSILPDHVVTVSDFVAGYLVQTGVPASHITTVPTGIDLERYQPDPAGSTLRSELGLAADTPLVGTVAILRRKKGHAELLEEVPGILARHPQAHFVFAGDGPQKESLERRIAELGLGEQVHLLGLRRDVVNVLQALDLFVLPTHQEALGTAFIEAAAMGVPAVATVVDGVPEAVVDGRTGLLVPPADGAALRSAISDLLAAPERRRTMGEAARERARQCFSRRAMAAGMVDVYNRLLAAAR